MKLAALVGVVTALFVLPVLGAEAAGTAGRGAPAPHTMQGMHGMDMSGMDMSGMDMSGMDMQGMDMQGMDMRAMDMSSSGHAVASSRVTVTVRTWGMQSSTAAVTAGAVTVVLRNSSSIRHRVAMFRSSARTGALPVKAQRPVVKHPVVSATVAPHASRPLKVELRPGRYIIVCTLRGHYGHGNVTALTVRAPTTAASDGTVFELQTAGMLKFNKATLQAPAGKVTLHMTDTVSLEHNIALTGPGVSIKGQIVGQGGVSTVSADLRPGTYTFFCSIPGHMQAGMKGTLVVTAKVGGAPPPPTGQPGDGGSPPPVTPPGTPSPGTPQGAIVLHTASQIGFNTTSLTASAGPVTLSLVNDSAIEHNIAIRGNGVDVAGPLVGAGGVSSVSATLAPGVYTFYCSVPGHAAAGMTGTLVVVDGGPPPSGALPPPSGLAATSTGATALTLGWTASPDPLTISYEVSRGATVLGTTPSTTLAVSGLLCNTVYSFSVVAIDRSGRRSTAATASVTTAACLPSPPPPPAGGTVLDLATSGLIGFDRTSLTAPAGTVTLRLTNSTPLEHNIALRGNGIDIQGSIVQQGGISTVSAALQPGVYTFYCVVSGHAGAGMIGTLTVTGTTLPPPPPPGTPLAPPTGFAASSIGQTTLTLSWTPSADLRTVGYEIAANGVAIGTTAASLYAASALTCGTAYTFGVAAVDAGGGKSATVTTTATTAACPPPPPAAGTVLDLTTSGQIGFSTHSLTAPAGSVTIRLTNTSGIQHNIALNGNGVALVGPVVGTGGVSSVTASLQPGTYTFYCTLSGHAASGMSGTLTVTGTGTPPPPPPPASGTVLHLSATGSHTFSTSTLTAPRGTITIVLDNKSSLGHALRIEGHGKEFTSAVAAPGASVSLTVTLDKADDYEFSCPLGNHRDLGMRGTLYVT